MTAMQSTRRNVRHRRLNGFTDYRFDAVIKVGGSLLRKLTPLQRTLREIDRLRGHGFRLLIIPGGGPTDKAVEEMYSRRSFSMEIAHVACALAQDQTGLILSDRSLSRTIRACDTLHEAIKIANAKMTPLLLPSRILLAVDPVERSWDVTSDAISGWFAWLTGTPRLAILTDVDGIFPPGRVGVRRELIRNMEARLLLGKEGTSIDARLPELIHSGRLSECAVLNGWRPDRLNAWVRGKPTICTTIRP